MAALFRSKIMLRANKSALTTADLCKKIFVRHANASRAMSSVSLSSLDDHVIGALSNAPLPGVSVGIIKPGEVEPIFRSYGVARYNTENMEMSMPVSEHTIFPIGSISKNFTALSIMQLVQQGKIELDAPIATYLPTVKINSSSPITIRHLLSHTSGIKEFRGMTDIFSLLFGGSDSKASDVGLRRYYEGGPALPVAAAPGQAYLKSHHNYGLLALLVEQEANLPVRDYFHKHIFEPLEMTSTDLVLREDMREQLSDAFRMTSSGAAVLKKALSGPVKAAQGGYTSAADMAKYVAALADPEGRGRGAVGAAAVDALLAPAHRADPFLPGQALSFNVQRVGWAPRAGGGGGGGGGEEVEEEEVGYMTAGQGMTWAGFQAAFAFSRARRTAVAVLSNCGTHNYEASALCSKVLKEACTDYIMTAPSKVDSKTVALQRALNSSKMDQAALWPKICGFYQLPLAQLLSPRLLWLMGGELQVYQFRGQHLELRSLFGPLATNWMRTGKGKPLAPADPNNPLHYTVAGTPNLVFSTPVRGQTDLRFDPENGLLHIGMITLVKRPFYLSIYYPFMAGVCFAGYKLIGKARAFDILSHATLLAPI